MSRKCIMPKRGSSLPRWSSSPFVKTRKGKQWIKDEEREQRLKGNSFGASLQEEITPEFVRDEVARGPSHHPDQHQPSGIGADDYREETSSSRSTPISATLRSVPPLKKKSKRWSGRHVCGGRQCNGSFNRKKIFTPPANGSCVTLPCPSAQCPSTRPWKKSMARSKT